MALDRRAGIEHFDEARIRDPNILKFIERIEVQHDPTFDAEKGRYRVGCRMVVRARGRAFETTVLYRRGSPEDPMSSSELQEKFKMLAGYASGLDVGGLAQAVSTLDASTSIEALAQFFVSGRD